MHRLLITEQPSPRLSPLTASTLVSGSINFSLSQGYLIIIFSKLQEKEKQSSNTSSTSKTNSPIFSNYIISVKKGRSNYSTWTSKIGLWLSGVGPKSHLTIIVESILT